MGRGMIAVFYALFESEASLGTGFFYAWGMGEKRPFSFKKCGGWCMGGNGRF